MSRPDPTHRRRTSSLAGLLLLGASIVVAACRTATPSISPTTAATPVPTSTPAASVVPSASAGAPASSPNADVDAVYDAIEEQVIGIRGLEPLRPVERQFIDETELRTMITAQFDEDTPPEYLAANDRLYKALGLIPADSDLRDLTLDLLSGGVAGFYRNDQGKLYVVSKTGAPGPSERFYFSHEYDHALQDQNSTIFKDQDGVLDQSDRLLARQAIYEGDASLLMTQWAAGNLTQAELLELLNESNDPEAQAVLSRTPAILRESLTFPYTTGLTYMSAVQADGGWEAVDAYFENMPASTEQILHPEKYVDGEAPIEVSLPDDLATALGDGWTVPLQDTFGEFQLGIWLREGGVATADALDAAAGWGGDRLAVMQGPDGAWAVAIQTVWDSEDEAAEFETAATTALEAADGVATVLPGVGGATRWILVAGDDATADHVAGVLGLAG